MNLGRSWALPVRTLQPTLESDKRSERKSEMAESPAIASRKLVSTQEDGPKLLKHGA
jgi:hypothetical protein